jgi:hypothetical protein
LKVLRHVNSAPGPHRRASFPATWLLLGLAASGLGCGRSPENEVGGPEDEIELALNPTLLARNLQKAGGGHFKAVTTHQMSPTVEKGASEPNLVSTTTNTNLYMDRIGHYRLVENNDLEGGREVTLHSRQLAVALRYGKLIRRPAHEPEPTRFLEEALGGPWSAWEIARRFADVKRTEDPRAQPPAVVFTLSKAAVPRAVRGGFESDSPLRKWRETIAPQTLRGEVRLDKATGLVTAVNLETRFTLRRDGVPLSGAVRVEATLQNIGREKPISAPPAEELPTRQRTILEERALLGPKPGTDNSTRGR